MTTHEPELTEPVDLCTPDGSALNPAARGWSRQPLHRANLDGCFGVNKRWDYWAVLAGDLVVSAVYSDIDHLGLADVWWVDLVTGETGGKAIVAPAGGGIVLPERPGTAPLRVDRDGLDLQIVDDEVGTRLTATWTEPDGRAGHLDVLVELPAGSRVAERRDPVERHGVQLHVQAPGPPRGGRARRWATGGGRSADRTDPSRGACSTSAGGGGRTRSPWNWGGGAGRSGEHVVGLQIGAKWTEGTGFTENGVIVDGRLSKLGSELRWDYDWDAPMEPWHVEDPGGQLDIVLTPRFDKHSHMEGGEYGSETHQVFGTWSGRLRTDDGLELALDGLQGFAEEARQRW